MAENPAEPTLDDVIRAGVSLPGVPQSAATARHLLRSVLNGRLTDALLDEVELMISELVGNAVKHGDGPCELTLSMAVEGVLRVSVSDSNTARAQLRPVDVESISGRGLQMVNALAMQWGGDRMRRGGNSVWFEVPI